MAPSPQLATEPEVPDSSVESVEPEVLGPVVPMGVADVDATIVVIPGGTVPPDVVAGSPVLDEGPLVAESPALGLKHAKGPQTAAV